MQYEIYKKDLIYKMFERRNKGGEGEEEEKNFVEV